MIGEGESMSNEQYRTISTKLRRLNALESLVAACAEELFDLVGQVCGKASRDVPTGKLPVLMVDPVRFVETRQWSILYRLSPVLHFHVTIGYMAAVPQAVARCEISVASESVSVLHYVKRNDHGQWVRIDAADQHVPVDEAMILGFVSDVIDERLKHYPK